MTWPDEAVDAAADILRSQGWATTETHGQKIARAAVEAAMPAIREAIAQEIEHEAKQTHHTSPPERKGLTIAARIVRGGTP